MAPVDAAALLAGALLLLGPAALVLGPRRAAAIYAAAALLCALVAGLGLTALLTGATSTTVLPIGLPWLGAHLRLDPLAAVFTLLLGLGGAAASLSAIGYFRHEPAPMRVLPFFPAFLGAMLAVLIADDAFSFLMSWEVMSLLSWALVMVHHREAETRTAGFVYLMMAAFGTMALLLAFGLMAGPAGGYGFDAIRAVPRSPLVTAVILGLMLLGAGSKAGLAPLHVWLPLAHPAAPSPVSALMSAVMTKVALYAFLRVVFDLMGPAAWWASPVVILLGAATAVLGILLAMIETDIKRVLACSTIENIGVIFAAVGLAMAFRADGMPAAAALALTAALFHAFNHMAMKSLLFLGAGAVLGATGTRMLDRMGGLIHRMPVTAALMLLGVTAIAALPPLNGFASEWLVFQAVLLSPGLPQPVLQMLVPAAGGLLALAAALAAAAFVRLYGVAFLGRPRSDAAATAPEADRPTLIAMGALGALCVFAGLLPGIVLDALAPVSAQLTGANLPQQAGQPWLTLVPIAATRSTYNGLLVAIFIAISGGLVAVAVHRFASRALRRAPAWDCGFPLNDPTTQYGAGSFAQPLRRVLGAPLLGARETVLMPPPGDLSPARLTVSVGDPVWQALYAPLAQGVTRLSIWANRFQFLTIRRYLSLVFASLVLLLLGLTLWA
ncbi:MAG: hydrogenase 4 subunit B [Rhodobacteraceae bacterium]|nr:hydrogenase 4 subunit B [Paracoccaceae bacterium]